MTFGRPYDVGPLNRYVLVLQDEHMTHLVDTTQACIVTAQFPGVPLTTRQPAKFLS